jgi:hypothetical protein
MSIDTQSRHQHTYQVTMWPPDDAQQPTAARRPTIAARWQLVDSVLSMSWYLCE